jgi:hypothetical protein
VLGGSTVVDGDACAWWLDLIDAALDFASLYFDSIDTLAEYAAAEMDFANADFCCACCSLFIDFCVVVLTADLGPGAPHLPDPSTPEQ